MASFNLKHRQKVYLTHSKENRTRQLSRIQQSAPRYFQLYDYNHGCPIIGKYETCRSWFDSYQGISDKAA